MQKTPIAIWGASGHALVVSNIANLCEQYEVIGYLDDINPNRKGEIFNGKPILGGLEVLAELHQQGINHIALGFGHCKARVKLAEMLKKNNFHIITLIHPTAVVAENTDIDEGAIISGCVVIDPGCKIGRYVIVNNGTLICHGSTIGDGVHLCPGVSIGGNVTVGVCSWVGIGSCIIDNVNIGDSSYIGAGSVVVKDIPKGVLAYGDPARVIRSIDEEFWDKHYRSCL